ncbi:hypothetical protein QYE76_005064 [Lolium multiflorum]|uniref:CCHC-type domain-containing protein n=1 Tax=Lolium multiflorum TaxID=4521 RepID=A0AAD8RU02_LOLMU|nr:hypothetical protein QYE76_005064 [Lolium multiflorum]
MKPKNGPKPDAECYYCKEKGHWKRNCSKYLADLKSGLVKKKKEGMEHWTTVKNILKYLKRTKDMFLCYGGDQELVVTSYTDASWNTDPDDSKSQSGYVFILNGAAVSWASSKQCTVAKSSTESEYIAASGFIRSGLHERDIFDLFLPEFDKPWVIHLRETCCCSTNLCSWRPNTLKEKEGVDIKLFSGAVAGEERNPSKEIFSELDEINARGPIFTRSFQKTGGLTKWGHEAPPQQAARPGCGRAAWRVGPSCGPDLPFRLHIVFIAKPPIESHDTENLPETPPPPIPSRGIREIASGTLPERESSPGGLFIAMIASGVMSE